MAESSEVQALEKISTEVGESQIKITLSSQCIKAQAFLVDKLRKQTERQKEICNFISSSNLKLQTEIKQAELEIKSLLIAHDTVKSGNIEIRKELLLTKEKKSEIEDRVINGEKKYEALWLEAKERYEGIPFVQKVLQATSKTEILKENYIALENKSLKLIKEINTKKEYFSNLDRNRVIDLADYFVNILPNILKSVREKSTAINEMSEEIEGMIKAQEAAVSEHFIETTIEQKQEICADTKIAKLDDSWMDISTNNERDTMLSMPRLQFINSDFDALNARLDEIKIMKVEIMNTSSKGVNSTKTNTEFCNKNVKDDEFSIFYNSSSMDNNNTGKGKESDTYSKRKLINILDDVKLNKNDTYNVLSNINLDNLKDVTMIGKDNKQTAESKEVPDLKDTEIIEEIDLTKSSVDNNSSSLLVPPTQFLDLSQEKMFSNSQQQVEVIVHMSMTEPSQGNMSQSLKESISKKRVSFDLPLSIQEITNETNEDDLDQNKIEEIKPNETIDSQMDISVVSDESYSKIKDMILKKHNLDLSPQFTYGKNKMLQLNTEEKLVTSKFFQTEKTGVIEDNKSNGEQIKLASKDNEYQQLSIKDVVEKVNDEEMDTDQVFVSSPKASQSLKADRPVTGLLFNHNTQGIPDSLNVSISTTGFEEGDPDYPHCIDSSLLLSPKADIPIPMSGENIDVTSQEIPNFLSGLRKTGLSFFGQSTVSETKPDTSEQNIGSNFNFNFGGGGGEQKARGGLFSMFR